MSHEIIGEPFLKQFDKRKRKVVLRRCECGKENYVQLSDIHLGKSLQCKNCTNRQYVGEISGGYFYEIKSRAKKRGIEFKITKEYIWDLFLQQDRRCKYTGLILVFGDGSKERSNVRTASLDRIDSKKCYENENIQWIHQKLNFMKQQLSEEEFFFWCELITERRKQE